MEQKGVMQMRLWKTALVALAAALSLCLPAFAQEAEAAGCTVSDGTGARWQLTDNSTFSFVTWPGGARLTVSSDTPFAALYFIWDRPPGAWTGEAAGQSFAGGEYGFLHEYAPLAEAATEAVVNVPAGATLCEVYALTEGGAPDWVQVWLPPCEDADLLALPTHADDEHLFFGGILPLYAGEKQLDVQVCYFTNHWGERYRPHELLNGLWTVGVRHYPVFSDFPDQYAGSLAQARSLYDEGACTAWQVEQLRRFKPEVVVGHDVNGEYGHGVHMLNTATLQTALEAPADASQYAESAETYGVWDVPKAYLHLYEENAVVLDWSVPLEAFGGKTALEMAKLGFAEHASQQTYFAVEDFGPYDCRKFGLYRSLVGADEEGADLFEHITEDMYSDYVPPEPEPEPEPAPEPEPEPPAQSAPEGQAQSSAPVWVWVAEGVLIVCAAGAAAALWRRRKK